MVSERVIPVSLAPQHELVRAWLTGVRFEALPSVPEWDGDASGSSEIDARIVVRPTPGPERSLRVRAWLWTTDGRAWLVARSADSRSPVPDLAVLRPGSRVTVRGDRPGGTWWWDEVALLDELDELPAGLSTGLESRTWIAWSGIRPGAADPWLSPVAACTRAAHGRALRLQGRMGWAETVAAVEHVEGPESVSVAVRVGIDEEMAFVRSVARRPLSQARRHMQDWRVTVRLGGPLAGRRVTDQAGPDDEAAAMTAWRRWRERLTITL